MGTAKIADRDEARRQLLIEGSRSYLKAATALIVYQQEVQKKCRKVMERYLQDYSLALKLKNALKSSEIAEHRWPQPNQWEGNWASVGVHVGRRDIPGLSWWEAYCSLELRSEEPVLYCWVGETFPTGKIATVLFDKLRRLSADISLDDTINVGIALRLRADEAFQIEEKLDDLFPKWINLWKKVGGTKAVFKA